MAERTIPLTDLGELVLPPEVSPHGCSLRILLGVQSFLQLPVETGSWSAHAQPNVTRTEHRHLKPGPDHHTMGGQVPNGPLLGQVGLVGWGGDGGGVPGVSCRPERSAPAWTPTHSS